MDAVSNYLVHNLHLTQVRVDGLRALVQSWGDDDDSNIVAQGTLRGLDWIGIRSALEKRLWESASLPFGARLSY
jgi:hypothetical protein